VAQCAQAAQVYTYIYIYVYSYVYARTHTHTQAHTRTYTHARSTHTHTHTYTNVYTYTQTRTHTHTRQSTHAHTYIKSRPLSCTHTGSGSSGWSASCATSKICRRSRSTATPRPHAMACVAWRRLCRPSRARGVRWCERAGAAPSAQSVGTALPESCRHSSKSIPNYASKGVPLEPLLPHSRQSPVHTGTDILCLAPSSISLAFCLWFRSLSPSFLFCAARDRGARRRSALACSCRAPTGSEDVV